MVRWIKVLSDPVYYMCYTFTEQLPSSDRWLKIDLLAKNDLIAALFHGFIFFSRSLLLSWQIASSFNNLCFDLCLDRGSDVYR